MSGVHKNGGRLNLALDPQQVIDAIGHAAEGAADRARSERGRKIGEETVLCGGVRKPPLAPICRSGHLEPVTLRPGSKHSAGNRASTRRKIVRVWMRA